MANSPKNYVFIVQHSDKLFYIDQFLGDITTDAAIDLAASNAPAGNRPYMRVFRIIPTDDANLLRSRLLAEVMRFSIGRNWYKIPNGDQTKLAGIVREACNG